MATLPRSSNFPSRFLLPRPHSEFDAGINTSAAWTEHLEAESTTGAAYLSDEEPETDDADAADRPARALYAFEGKPEFRELRVEAGDGLFVMKEDLADGWSLVKNASGEIGLLPRTYYTFTSDFAVAPQLEFETGLSSSHENEASDASITPRGSPQSSAPRVLPVVPQNTGEWFPSFRQSLLRGKSLNRFSSFVTSGAEDFVLKGVPADVVISPADLVPPTGHERDVTSATIVDEDEQNRLNRLGMGEADRHFVDAGPIWKEKLPPFRVLVHSPSKRTSMLSGAFTVYSVSSLFYADPQSEEDYAAFETEGSDQFIPSQPPSPARITVYRRFSHFVILHTALTRRLPGIALPPLPEKQYAGRFSADFVEARRGDLERYINKVVRHPIARNGNASSLSTCLYLRQDLRSMHAFSILRLISTLKMRRRPSIALTFIQRPLGRAYRRYGMCSAKFGRPEWVSPRNMSKAERLLSYSLLSLITSKPLASAPVTGVNAQDEQYSAKAKGLLNEDGAWCWREDCSDCLKLTKAMQRTAETLQNVADLYDDHARRTLLATHESLKSVAHPSSVYEGVVSTHRSTLSRYQEATHEVQADEDVAARCETVLNTTMAEMETYHTQKNEDFLALTKDYLDGEINFYEQVLSRLRAARRVLDPPQFERLSDSPRQASIYERELENPRLNAGPLPQPCPHVFDSAPMRPVSVAVQEGLGLFLGASGRGSVFGRFF